MEAKKLAALVLPAGALALGEGVPPAPALAAIMAAKLALPPPVVGELDATVADRPRKPADETDAAEACAGAHGQGGDLA